MMVPGQRRWYPVSEILDNWPGWLRAILDLTGVALHHSLALGNGSSGSYV